MNITAVFRLLTGLMPTLVVLTCWVPGNAFADSAGSHDHPLLSRYPGSKIIAYDAKEYDAVAIEGSKKRQWVYGKTTWIVYQVSADNSTLQVYRNYQVALADAGFDVAYACELEACGRHFIKNSLESMGRMVGGSEGWMPGSGRYIAASKSDADGDKTWVSILVHERDTNGTVAIREEIVEPQVARTVALATPFGTNFVGAKQFGGKYRKYDSVKVPAAGASNGKLGSVLSLEGELSWKVYVLRRSVAAIEVIHSYRRALQAAGYEHLFFCWRHDCGDSFMRDSLELGRSITPNGDHWIEDSQFYLLMRRESAEGAVHMAIWAYTQPNGYDAVRALRVVAKPLALGLIKVSAESMAKKLRSDGVVRVYGIYFDLDKDRVRPDSKPVLDEIAHMLTSNPDISLYVDGHTDSQGGESYNLDLSKRRAFSMRS
ncbi:MAG: DUF4892 domain-containing protein [Rhodanobacteraceae bacterium]